MSSPVECCEVCGEAVRVIAYKGTGRCSGTCAESAAEQASISKADYEAYRNDPGVRMAATLREDWTP